MTRPIKVPTLEVRFMRHFSVLRRPDSGSGSVLPTSLDDRSFNFDELAVFAADSSAGVSPRAAIPFQASLLVEPRAYRWTRHQLYRLGAVPRASIADRLLEIFLLAEVLLHM